jgi:hypothetical protein
VAADSPVRGDLARRLPIEALVEVEEEEGRPFAIEAAELIEVEAGYQKSPAAAANAYRLARAFLEATGVLAGTREPREVTTFGLGDPIAKPRAEH